MSTAQIRRTPEVLALAEVVREAFAASGVVPPDAMDTLCDEDKLALWNILMETAVFDNRPLALAAHKAYVNHVLDAIPTVFPKGTD